MLTVFLSQVWTWSLQAQVRIIQWSDAHSTLETLTRQVLAIDRAGQEFLRTNPRGEVVIHILGDFTSITPYTIEEEGWLSLEAIKILKERGHTVIFTPGNHDAFDWTAKVDGAELFLQQMRVLKSLGVEIIVNNLRMKTNELQQLTSNSYELKTLEPQTHLVGLTLPNLMTKSNLNDITARTLFDKMETLPKTLERVLPFLSNKGAEAVIIGVHKGHNALARQVPAIHSVIREKKLDIQVPLLMGAHDHLAASFREKGVHIADGGSHGSFNIIDFDRSGELQTDKILHISNSQQSALEVDPQLFQEGQIKVNSIEVIDILNEPWLYDYHKKVERQLGQLRKKLGRRLLTLKNGIFESKHNMKKRQTLLGAMLSESLVNWARHRLGQQNSDVKIIAMVNSSTYRLEHLLPPGDISELTFRQMYPFLTEATLYKMQGRALQSLYFSLRKFYANGNPEFHSPQLNFGVREFEDKLQIQSKTGTWSDINLEKHYWVALDAWLSEHRFGQSYHIIEWRRVLKSSIPKAVAPFQKILTDYLPKIMQANDERVERIHKAKFCRMVFN